MAHSSLISLSDCEFRVSLAGNRRVRAERKKYVHAYVHGVVRQQGRFLMPDLSEYIRISYNPYCDTCFTNYDTGEAIVFAEEVVMFSIANRVKCYAKGAQ